MSTVSIKNYQTTTTISATDGEVKCIVTLNDGEVTGVSFAGKLSLQTQDTKMALIEAICEEMKVIGSLTKENLLDIYTIV